MEQPNLVWEIQGNCLEEVTVMLRPEWQVGVSLGRKESMLGLPGRSSVGRHRMCKGPEVGKTPSLRGTKGNIR